MTNGSVCLLAVDLFARFDHEHGVRLLDSLRERHAGFEAAVHAARRRSIPIVYANDTSGDWHGEASVIVHEALSGPAAAELEPLAPRPGDAFIVKPRYSAFDLTPLELILTERHVTRLLLIGMATEMCVTQTAIDGRERGFELTVITSACATISTEVERTALQYLEQVTGTFLAPTVDDACDSDPVAPASRRTGGETAQ
jgi:nicotinamidase-related amidase